MARAEPARAGTRRGPRQATRPQRGSKEKRADGQNGARHLFADWPEIRGRLRGAKSVALFSDFDGTLVPIQRHADEVYLPPSRRRLLARLANHPRIHLWIVTGRRLADIRKRTRAAGVRLAGLHGWERGNGIPNAEAAQKTLREAERALESRLRDLRGIRIEDKEWAFAVHYRGAGKSEVSKARAALRKVLDSCDSGLCFLPGKMVWEIIPCQIVNRGQAVSNLLAEAPRGALPIYLGDDSTDELAFQALPQGITVHVGAAASTHARYYLRSPEEVMEFLGRIEREIS